MQVISIVEQVLTLIGALGLFLFGMKLMSEALQSCRKQDEEYPRAMTNNRLRGVLTGILITTTIQSSSATTVMVVSFANAGLLSIALCHRCNYGCKHWNHGNGMANFHTRFQGKPELSFHYHLLVWLPTYLFKKWKKKILG